MTQSTITTEYLLQLQNECATQLGYKVDIYHSESERVIAIFPHNYHPTPFNAIRVINY